MNNKQYEDNKTMLVGCKIICPTCKSVFTKKQYNQVFCCIKCKDKFHKSMQKNKRNTCVIENNSLSLQSQIKKEENNMKKFVVFVFPNQCTNKVIEVNEYASDYSHIKRMAERVLINGMWYNVFAWGDYLWSIRKINNPIDIQGKLYQIVDLNQFGYFFSQETSDDNGKTFESLDLSKSFTSYEECYNAMKLEAMSTLAADIDINQDFEVGQGTIHQANVKFKETEISYSMNNKIMRFKMYIRI